MQTRSEEEEDSEDSATYQLEMMRSLREVNVDNNTVGWYQSTYMGAYQSVELIDTFLQYQVRRGCVARFGETVGKRIVVLFLRS